VGKGKRGNEGTGKLYSYLIYLRLSRLVATAVMERLRKEAEVAP